MKKPECSGFFESKFFLKNLRITLIVIHGKAGAGQRQIWVLEAGSPKAVRVQTGISDGRVTEVHSDALQPGMQVITDQLAAGAKP